MGTQVPKGLGIGLMVVGVPLILWSAAGSRTELDALEAQTGTREARVERCLALVHEHRAAAPADQLPLCNCIVDRADERGIDSSFGGYDQDGIEAVIKSCSWELGL